MSLTTTTNNNNTISTADTRTQLITTTTTTPVVSTNSIPPSSSCDNHIYSSTNNNSSSRSASLRRILTSSSSSPSLLGSSTSTGKKSTSSSSSLNKRNGQTRQQQPQPQQHTVTKVSAKKLGSNYLLINHVIGRGSYAEVYEGYRRGDKLPVAIKVISRNKLSDVGQQSLEKEISVMRLVNHDNIVRLFDVHRSKRHYYLVMERCFGPDLATYMKRNNNGKPLPEHVTHKFLTDLAFGLKALNFIHLVHRDLKPANLMLSRRTTGNELGVLKIADFGFAREIQPNDLAETLCGSPLYMAPEILECKKYDAKADLWSVGVIMYEMLFGRAPYSAINMLDLLNTIKKTQIVYPEGVASPFAIQFLKGLLQPDPDYRMSFSEFFDHPYLNLKGQANYEDRIKGIALPESPGPSLGTTHVVDEDKDQNSLDHTCENKGAVTDLEESMNATQQPTKTAASAQDLLDNVATAPSHQHWTLDTLIKVSDGRVIYPQRIVDFSTTNSIVAVANNDKVGICQEIEQGAYSAWSIAEAAYLLQLNKKFVEALSLYSKSLDILNSMIETIRIVLLENTNNNSNTDQDMVAWESWTIVQFHDLMNKVDSICQYVTSDDNLLSRVCAEDILYRYALKLARESTHLESLHRFSRVSSSERSQSNHHDRDQCVIMYHRSKIIFEYLLKCCEYLNNEEDRKFLDTCIQRFDSRIRTLACSDAWT